jgi:acetyltransferase
LRYFHMAQLSTRVAHERLIRKCVIDYDREMALVAELTDPDTGDTCIGAVARLSRAPLAGEAEIGVIVADKFQHQGLGAELIKKLIDIARIEKIQRIVADFHSENSAIRHLAKHGGATVTRTSDATCFRIQLAL